MLDIINKLLIDELVFFKKNMQELLDQKENYRAYSINEKLLPKDPLELFKNWFNLAIKNKLKEPNAMILATCSSVGKPSVRVVLLKYFDQNGFVFFTNYNSRKGIELESNPYASLLFYWSELQKQIRVEGHVKKVPEKISDQYFNIRPKESRISACISPQSQYIPSRKYLKTLYLEYKMEKKDLKRPDNWGGYFVKPYFFEFWQGQPYRLHDRIIYEQVDNAWKIGRLAP